MLYHPLGQAGTYKIGDFWWTDLNWKDGSPEAGASARLCVLVPARTHLGSFVIRIYCSTNASRDNDPEDRLWNGDWDNPTIELSITGENNEFHLYIKDGFLEPVG